MSNAIQLLHLAESKVLVRASLKFALPDGNYDKAFRVNILLITCPSEQFVKAEYDYDSLRAESKMEVHAWAYNDYNEEKKSEFIHDVCGRWQRNGWYSENQVEIVLQKSPRVRRNEFLPASDFFTLQHLCRARTLIEAYHQSHPQSGISAIGMRLDSFIAEQNRAWGRVTSIPMPG